MGNNNLFLPASLLKQKPIYKARDLYTGIKKKIESINYMYMYFTIKFRFKEYYLF